jgi:predicted  nucleic acid-binding Zn-ribbon protein
VSHLPPTIEELAHSHNALRRDHDALRREHENLRREVQDSLNVLRLEISGFRDELGIAVANINRLANSATKFEVMTTTIARGVERLQALLPGGEK